MQKIYHRKDLRCPTDCNLPLYYRRFRRIGCCDCQSCSLYDIQLVTLALKHLGIEIQIVHQDGLKDYYTLWHQHGNLTDVPINTCKVNGTMFKIDLSFNKIQIMTRITCLQMLDTLILRGNQIQFIQRDKTYWTRSCHRCSWKSFQLWCVTQSTYFSWYYRLHHVQAAKILHDWLLT